MKKCFARLLIILALTSFSCRKVIAESTLQTDSIVNKMATQKAPKKVSYTYESPKIWLKTNQNEGNVAMALAINRTDKEFFTKMDSVLIPTDFAGNIAYYFPFPLKVRYLKNIDKIIFFSYPTQTFAAYEHGVLLITGPTNMGRKKDPTPTGLFFTNWKAEETTSTFDDEWKLRWNFNIENKMGIGFHQYNLPGYPTSHSCLRLHEKDAKDLYQWADQWVLANAENVKYKGTPVIIFGRYDFDAPKPWLQLLKNPKALSISQNEITKITAPFVNRILMEQEKRRKS